MCGIAGIHAYRDTAPPVDRGELLRIREHMVPRGPDGAGLWLADDGRVGFGHRRLAIIDLSEGGAQPMHSADGRYVITFNGEIYNYRELRRELEAEGARFRSHSDTEVMLELYARRGERMLAALRGMYAFGIFDRRDRRLFLARDPYGIKPLYYADDGGCVRFASQVKALLAGGAIATEPDPAGLAGFLMLGSVPEPFTTVRAIRSLEAGATLTFGPDASPSPGRHFDLRETLLAAQDVAVAPGRTGALLREAVSEAVTSHLVADVPVGVFLSAGIDSGTVTGLAAEISGSHLHTLTLGFHEYLGTPEDEIPLAAAVARQYGTVHHAESISRDDFHDELPRILAAMDQPTIDGVNTYLVSRAAARAGMKVALSGLGGDELLGGYPSFRQVPRLVRAVGWARDYRRLGRAARVLAAPVLRRVTSPKYSGLLEYGGSFGGAYLLRRGLFMPWELDSLLDPDIVRAGLDELDLVARLEATTRGLRSPRARVVALESTWYMRNQLLRDADWAGMAHSVEIRVPLVDSVLLRQLAPYLSSPEFPTKSDLARIPRPALPDALVTRAKTGFTTPVRDWIDSNSTASQRGLRGWATRIVRIAPQAPPHESPVAARLSRTVVVYRIGQLGDTLIAIPAIRAIRARHRHDRLVLLTDQQLTGRGWVSSWDVLGPLDLFDDVVFYRPSTHPGGFAGSLASITASLRQLKADVVYNLAPTRTAWQSRRDRLFFVGLLGARHYVAPKSASPAPQRAPGMPRPVQPEWQRLLEVVRPDATDPDRTLCVSPALEETALQKLADAGGAIDRPLIAIAPGSKMPAKRWPDASFAAVIAALAAQCPDHQFVVLGDSRDGEIGERLSAPAGNRCVNLAGRLTIFESAAILRRCRLYIGNDTGTMHLAAAVGCRCVAIFSARDRPGRWDPIGSGHAVLRREVPCSGCMLSVFDRHANACLTGITPADVVGAALGILGQAETRPHAATVAAEPGMVTPGTAACEPAPQP